MKNCTRVQWCGPHSFSFIVCALRTSTNEEKIHVKASEVKIFIQFSRTGKTLWKNKIGEMIKNKNIHSKIEIKRVTENTRAHTRCTYCRLGREYHSCGSGVHVCYELLNAILVMAVERFHTR